MMQANAFRSAETDSSITAIDEPDEGVIVVDSALTVLGLDRGAEAILKSVGYWEPNLYGTSLPIDLCGPVDTCSPEGKPIRTVVGNAGYTCRVFEVRPLNGVIKHEVFALHLNRAPSIGKSLTKVIEAYHLTDREGKILEGISLGLTTKTLAARMNISPNTVNAFLRMIMIKLGVTTRAGIVGKVLAESPAGDGKRSATMRRMG